jgi:hypothetical protein
VITVDHHPAVGIGGRDRGADSGGPAIGSPAGQVGK